MSVSADPPPKNASQTRPESTSAWGALRQMGPWSGLFVLLCVATFFEGFDTKLASFVQPVIRDDFGASVGEVGTAVGISSFGMVLAFFVILLADTVGRRPIFLAGLAAYAVFTFATAFAPNLVTFTVLQFFGRMAMVVELFLAYLILSEEMPAEIRGRVNGIFASTAAFGAAIPAALLAPLQTMGVGWRGLFLIGALPILLFPLYYSRIKETRAFQDRTDVHKSYGEDFRRIARSLWHSEHRGRLIRMSCLWLAINFWSGTAMYFFTTYVYDERGWTPEDLQLLPWGTIPIGLAGYIYSGFLMDRIGRRPAASVYFVAAFLATLLCYRSTENWAIYLGFFLLFGMNGVWVIITTWTTELFPTETRATALAIANNLVGRMGLVFGPIVAGLLSESWASPSLAISALSLVTLAILPVVWSLPETNGIELRAEEADSA